MARLSQLLEAALLKEGAHLDPVGIPFYEILKQLLCIIKVAQIVLSNRCLRHNPVTLWKLLGQSLHKQTGSYACLACLLVRCRAEDI